LSQQSTQPPINKILNVTTKYPNVNTRQTSPPLVILSPVDSQINPNNHNTTSPSLLNSSDSNSSSSSSSSTTCPTSAASNMQRRHSDKDKYTMTDLEHQQVNAIKEAYSHAIQLVRSQGLPCNSKDINTTINITELGVRRIIFFFKLISDFRDLPHDLMLKILKQNMMSLLQIHGVNSYDRSQNTFKQPDTDDVPFTAESLKSTYGDEIYQITMSITNNLYDLCNGNMSFIKIVMLVVLFDPQNEWLDASEKILIEELQNKYVTLLYSYMCNNFGSSHAEFTFKGLIFELNKINDLSKLFERAVVEKSNYEEVRPLMQEVFCLSNANTPPLSNSTFSSSQYSSMSGSVYSNNSSSVNSFYENTSFTNNNNNTNISSNKSNKHG
jgi:hypothetical protein